MDKRTLTCIRGGLTGPDRVRRAESVDALAMVGDVTGLRAALGSADSYVRARAVKALAALPGDGLPWRLVPLVLLIVVLTSFQLVLSNNEEVTA